MKGSILLNGTLEGRPRQRGLAMVEFSIGAPVLLLLLLAVGEFGRMLSNYNVLLHASRDAARYAAHNAWNSTTGKIDKEKVKVVVENFSVYGLPSAASTPLLRGLSADLVELTACAPENELIVCDFEHIQVTIRYTFQPVIGSVLPNFFGEDIPLGMELVATTVMRVL